MSSKIESIGSCVAKVELVPQNLKGSDPDSLAGQYAAWTQDAGVSAYTLVLPYKGECIKMNVVAKGAWQTAANVTVAIPGFAVDNRGYAPSLKFFDPDRDQGAFVAISLIGPGTYFPDSLNPTPEVLSEIYAAAARMVAPKAIEKAGGLNLVGSSMAGMIAMGAALELANDKTSPVIADVGIDNSITWDVTHETHTFLYNTLATIQPGGKSALGAGLAATLSIPKFRNDLVNVLYGIDQERGFKPASQDDRDYYRALLKQKKLFPFFARTADSIDQWDEYFLESFPQQVVPTPGAKHRERIDSILLPRQGVILDSQGDRLFRGETSRKLFTVVEPTDSDIWDQTDQRRRCNYLVSPNPDSHIEQTPRALRIHEALK